MRFLVPLVGILYVAGAAFSFHLPAAQFPISLNLLAGDVAFDRVIHPRLGTTDDDNPRTVKSISASHYDLSPNERDGSLSRSAAVSDSSSRMMRSDSNSNYDSNSSNDSRMLRSSSFSHSDSDSISSNDSRMMRSSSFSDSDSDSISSNDSRMLRSSYKVFISNLFPVLLI
ncbi:uncharacterized protein LOC123514603 isoform X4 [Portunus trituberculatus]|uniref:uncharacterized protein LOC123514603 isoform X3 n=1 Tax=Portunus trituberculatus TaxID=210409 RepID=UPI001E1CE544|nr:uncharacterized protein LOC123514603 isoform X3 [Portunus trituberculatus]XP_045128538.1 uncharacterized protein LOC123514603 isoform X4 [Portunus trituberculatus]